MSNEESYVGAALATTIAAKAAPTVEFSPDKTRLTGYWIKNQRQMGLLARSVDILGDTIDFMLFEQYSR